MTKRNSVYLALIGAVLLVAGGVLVWAQAAQQTGDLSQTNSSTAAKSTKKKKADDPATKTTAPAAAAVAATPAKSKTATAQQAPPANSAGMVWVNTDSGIYHKPGTRWYGKTKQGKYMTEADAVKAGYKASGKN
jgi:cytoskeletal protein RodZ